MSCPHRRQDLPCSCTAGDEEPNTQHHELCGRQGQPCNEDEICNWQEFAACCMGCGKRRIPLVYPIEMWMCRSCDPCPTVVRYPDGDHQCERGVGHLGAHGPAKFHPFVGADSICETCANERDHYCHVEP